MTSYGGDQVGLPPLPQIPAQVRGQRGQAGRLQRGAVLGLLGGHRLAGRQRIDGQRAAHRLRQNLGREVQHLASFARREVVHLVQHTEQRHRPVPHRSQEIPLATRNGRVGRQDEHRRVHRVQRRRRRRGRVGEHRTHPGGIHQIDPAIQQRRRDLQHHLRQPQPVVRIGRLGNQPGQFVDRPGLTAPIQIAHLKQRRLPMPHHRR